MKDFSQLGFQKTHLRMQQHWQWFKVMAVVKVLCSDQAFAAASEAFWVLQRESDQMLAELWTYFAPLLFYGLTLNNQVCFCTGRVFRILPAATITAHSHSRLLYFVAT